MAAAPAAATDPQVAVPVPTTQAAGGIPRKALWIGGGLVAALVIVYAIAAGGGEKLTTQRAQQAVSQWSGGGIAVTGVQEIPQQNAATAALSFSNFNIRQQGFFGQTNTRAYTGPGEATFTHYTDGRWVLVKVSTSESFNSVWWDNLNIQVR